MLRKRYLPLDGALHKRWLERAMVTPPVKWIGQSVTRLEDPPLVTGRAMSGTFHFHQLHMRVVRSDVAHGKIVAVDTRAAKALPGVVAVWSAADIPDIPPVDFREDRVEKLDPYRQPVLASDRVRYVGDPVAVVFADDPYLAEDAADLVTVEIEELAVMLDAEAAPGEFEPGRDTEATSSSRATATSTPRLATRMRLLSSTLSDRPPFRRAAGDARRHRPLRCGARHARAARRRQNSAPQPRAALRACWIALRRRSICTRSMSAAVSAFAASFIPRMCWSASPRCGSAAR